LSDEFGGVFVGRTDSELDFSIVLDRSRQHRAIACHASQARDNPVLIRRLELQGDREVFVGWGRCEGCRRRWDSSETRGRRGKFTHLHADHLSGARVLSDQTGASLHSTRPTPLASPFPSARRGPLRAGRRGRDVVAGYRHQQCRCPARSDRHPRPGGLALVAAFIVAAVVARWSATGSPLSFARAAGTRLHRLVGRRGPLCAARSLRASSERLSPYVCSCEQAVRPGQPGEQDDPCRLIAASHGADAGPGVKSPVLGPGHS